MSPIFSARHLASILGEPLEHLRDLATASSGHYTTFSKIDLKKGKSRTFHNPSNELKDLQRRIVNNVVRKVPIESLAHGGVKGKSPSTNAALHLRKRCVVTVDVRDFFPSIRHYLVYRMFRHELGYGKEVCRLLTRLTTLGGGLPQGAPTSTAIANLLLRFAVDIPISVSAKRHHLDVTRFVDDFAVSGDSPQILINEIARALSRRRLRVWRKKRKLRIMRCSKPQEVTGLNVNSDRGPSVPRYKRDAIRAAIHRLRLLSKKERASATRSIRGQVAYVRQTNPGSAKRLEKSLEAGFR
jgi:RNA-directed DNA polymerase